MKIYKISPKKECQLQKIGSKFVFHDFITYSHKEPLNLDYAI
jgi:hypothetical protein